MSWVSLASSSTVFSLPPFAYKVERHVAQDDVGCGWTNPALKHLCGQPGGSVQSGFCEPLWRHRTGTGHAHGAGHRLRSRWYSNFRMKEMEVSIPLVTGLPAEHTDALTETQAIG